MVNVTLQVTWQHLQPKWVEEKPIMGSDPGMKEFGPGLGRQGYDRNEVERIDNCIIFVGKFLFIMKTILQEIRNKGKSNFIPTTLTP